MITRQRVKAQSDRPLAGPPATRRHARVVAVITSVADLKKALRLRVPPDLFELRLDHLCRDLDKVENTLPDLSARAALIITARDSHEGGANNLPISTRRELLLRFLPYARYIDVELRAIRAFASVLAYARKRKISWIASFHDFESTPSLRELQNKLRAARQASADILKLAVRTESKSSLARLIEFFVLGQREIPLSAMGIGTFGVESRHELLRLGSVLNYASLGSGLVTGQPSLAQIRRWKFASPARPGGR